MQRFLISLVAMGIAGAIASLAFLSQPAAQAPGVNSPFAPVWAIPVDSIKRTYGVTVVQLSAAAPATDIFQVCGSTNISRIIKVEVNGRATAVAPADVLLVKRSSPSLGGTVSQLSATVGVPLDSGSSASTGYAYAWTGNPTLGTLVGTIANTQYYLGNLTTGVSGQRASFTWADRPGSAVVLRGPLQCLSVNLSSGSFAANVWDITAEWTEE